MHKYIYVTPFLDEVKRVTERTKCKEPQQLADGKLGGLKRLLGMGCNVATTHALFYNFDKKVIQQIKERGYKLILDEVLDTVQPNYNIKIEDVNIMQNANYVEIKDDGLVVWKRPYHGKMAQDLFKYISMGNTYCVNGKSFVNVISIDVFNAFSDVTVCTYLFDSSVQKSYFDLHGVKYTKMSVKDGELTEYTLKVPPKEKIHIIDNPKMNSVGDSHYHLSKSWFSNKDNRDKIEALSRHLDNFRRNICECRVKDFFWTTFKANVDELNPSRYKKSFVACNSRATNKYRDRHYVAYPLNRFMSVTTKMYFQSRGIQVDEGMYTVSELIQFLYRSALRDGDDIYLYIPSKRMGELLIDFLNSKP